MPYDWRTTRYLARLKERAWNPDDPRFLRSKAFGWGYSFNFARLFRRRPNR
jgi:hypothetical protein